MDAVILTLVFIALVYLVAVYLVRNGPFTGGSVPNEPCDHTYPAEITNGVYKLKKVTRGDIKNLLALRVPKDDNAIVPNIYFALMKASYLQNWNGYSFWHNDTLIGFGSFANYEDGRAIEIYNVLVDSGYQSKGHGSVLTGVITKLIRLQSRKDIYLNTSVSNLAAIHMYQKNGYHITETIGDTVWLVKKYE